MTWIIVGLVSVITGSVFLTMLYLSSVTNTELSTSYTYSIKSKWHMIPIIIIIIGIILYSYGFIHHKDHVIIKTVCQQTVN